MMETDQEGCAAKRPLWQRLCQPTIEVTPGRAILALALFFFVILPVGCRQNINIRMDETARQYQTELDRAHLIGASPAQVCVYLDGQGIRHGDFTDWSLIPEWKRTIHAETKGLGEMLHPTLLYAVGSVGITFKFDVKHRLKSYSIDKAMICGLDL